MWFQMSHFYSPAYSWIFTMFMHKPDFKYHVSRISHVKSFHTYMKFKNRGTAPHIPLHSPLASYHSASNWPAWRFIENHLSVTGATKASRFDFKILSRIWSLIWSYIWSFTAKLLDIQYSSRRKIRDELFPSMTLTFEYFYLTRSNQMDLEKIIPLYPSLFFQLSSLYYVLWLWSPLNLYMW